MARAFQVTMDCTEPARVGEFWAEVLGYVMDPPPEGFGTWQEALQAFGVPEEKWDSAYAIVDPEEKGARMFFQRVPEGKQAKNRVHLDVRAAPGLEGADRTAALEGKAAELSEIGARVVRRFPPGPMDGGFIVMQDPEGNEFCLD